MVEPPIVAAPGPTLVTPEAFDELLARLRRDIESYSPPQHLDLGGEASFPAYDDLFGRICRALWPIFDPRDCPVILRPGDCEHICFHEDRFDKRSARIEGRELAREEWNEERAAHMLWVFPAILRPSLIVHNNQFQGYEAYLLAYPRGNPVNPQRRFYLSARPQGRTPTARREFKTAYPCGKVYWNDAMRAQPGRKHVIYRDPLRGMRW